ncbi:MAG TPA: MFS transporter [Acidimicrobiia bacterium]|nr:MFS transporter [Acidimicrobiia bacterium]
MSRRPPLGFIFAVTLTGILNNTLITPALPDILTDLGVPSERSGILVASGSTAGIVMAPVVGILADRFGRRLVLTVCLALFGTFGGVAALAPSFTVLLVARFIQGFGSAGLVNLAIVLIGDHWSGTERTRIVGRNSAVLTVGLAAIPSMSGVLTEAFGWRVAFAVFTVALLTAGVAWTILDGRRPADPPRVRDQVAAAATAIRNPVILATVVASLLVFVAIFGVMLTAFPIHLADEFGLGAAARGLVISIPAVTSTIAAFNLARIRSVLSPRRIVGVGAATFALAFVLLGVAGALAVVIAAALLFGAAEGSLIPTLQDLNVEAAPDEHRGAVVAVWVGAARLGQTVGPLMAGVGLALVGSGPTLVIGSGVALALLVVAVVGPLPRGTQASVR